MRKTLVVASAAAIAVTVLAHPATAIERPNPTPIPSAPDGGAAAYTGAPTIQRPLFPRAIPQNDHTSANPWNSIHNDPYASDTYTTAGPLGRAPRVISNWMGTKDLPVSLVVGLTFDEENHAVAASTIADTRTGTAWVRMYLLNPQTLATMATYDLPTQSFDPSDVYFRPAGTYFYSDADNNTVIGTSARTIMVLSHTDTAFSVVKTIDLTKAIPADDQFEALQPDYKGNTWFATKGGIMGTVSLPKGKLLGTYKMGKGEQNINSMAADEDGGLYIASTKYMYRFDATSTGKPKVTWKARYDAGDRVKPGQVGMGTGTTPTLVGSKYVTITDNADPKMHVLVFKRAKSVSGSRTQCKVAVFGDMAGSTENSLVATDSSIVVENNYGYTDFSATSDGKTTTPGLTRIDISSKGKCRTKWTNDEVSIPTVVTKLSVSNGLIYTYTKPAGPGTADPWYFTAIDYRTGKVVYSVLTGYGKLYNNHYAPIYLGPDGAAYVGVLGGLIRIQDIG